MDAPRRALPASTWADWDDEKLLELRLSDLDLRIEGTDIEDRIAELHKELQSKNLEFRPYFWLADEWFCPDGIPGVAIPFYLAHPRLQRLENSQMLEVEGGTREWCLRILRHEAGHAIENAYQLRSRPKRRELFGATSTPYPDTYSPRPHSRSYVIHLDGWYAQSHPDEDFAETFAVWLTPNSDWAARYAGWPALKKLEYVDRMMTRLDGLAPSVKTRRMPDALPSLRRTLRRHYERRRKHYGVVHRDAYDRSLRQIFDTNHDGSSAASFLSRLRRGVRRRVQRWTGEYQWQIDQVLEDMITRCRELDLRLAGSEAEAEVEFTALLTVQTMARLHTSRHRVPL